MAKLSLTEVGSLAAQALLQTKQANPTYTPSFSDWTGQLDKIGKIVNIIDDFGDESPELEGDMLPLGKTIEEVHEDLFLPRDYDPNGVSALAPKDPTFRPACWSYDLGEKTFSATVRMNKFEQAVNNPEDLGSLTTRHLKTMFDSRTIYRNQMKRQLIGNLITKVLSEQATAAAYAPSTVYSVNTVLQSAASSGVYGIVVKPITSTTYATYNTWDLNVANGFIIVLNTVVNLPRPIDTATGEAFLLSVKNRAEIASAESEGYSLNGNTLGALDAQRLYLYTVFGIKGVLDVQVKAGAFQLDQLALPVTQKAIKNFGIVKAGSTDVTSKVYAVLLDIRGLKLHPTYTAVRNDTNGQGDFINNYLHDQNTAFISRNTFITIYKDA